MPRGIYKGLSCKTDGHPPFVPTEHQKDALEAFLKSPYKGMLLYHKLGSGKTCTSIMIADALLRKKRIAHVYVMSPGSLRSGWLTEYCNVCGYKPKYIKKYFTFITYNYMVGRNLPDFTNSLVIIDEVHNLVNGAKNRSFNPTAIYNELLKSDCRILALSGTPVFNYVYEFALLGNLLKPGGEFPDIRHGTEGVDEIAFMTFFKDDPDNPDGGILPKNMTTMKRRLDGIISYYPGAGAEFVPRVINMEPIKVLMPPDQERNYWIQYEQENAMSRPPDEKLKRTDPAKYDRLKRMYIMALKNILTRRASNFYYRMKIPADIPDLTVKKGGWIEKEYFQDGALYKYYSTKFTVLLLNIVMHNMQKHVVFTFFKERSGVVLLKSILGMCGIHATIFSGDLNDEARRSILRRYNSPQNRYGELIKVLLVTEAGAEGISVLEARHMHILESSPRMSKTIQAIGRVARYKSHIKLPKEEQSVKIWRYWSMASEDPVTIHAEIDMPNGETKTKTILITVKETIDEILYKKGMRKVREIDSFLDILKQVSVTKWSEPEEAK
uniref:Helicase n=1 Tax=viral metagenome TaxID=1070528 RepID=A0A6C0EK00_9ZZZZ